MGDGFSVSALGRSLFRIAGVCSVGLLIYVASVHLDSRRSSFEIVRDVDDASVDVSAIALHAKARVDVERARVLEATGLKSTAANQKVANRTTAESISIEKLKSIRRCEKVEAQNCPVASFAETTDAGGYHALLTEETVSELAFLKALAEDELNRVGETQVPVSSLANAYIKHPNDNVREQALSLAALLVERDAAMALNIAAHAVRNTVSGPLAVQALRLMAETRSANPGLVEKTLAEALNTGGWEVRDAAAAEILPFLTRENRNSFAQILAQAPVRSKRALHLRLSLEEFDRMERL